MTTLTRFFGFDGIHYMWVHSRPYTKRMRTRLARGVIAQVPALISRWLHFPHWIGVVLVLPALVYLLYTLLAFLGDDIGWEQRQRDEKLAALLASPDLEQRFTALSLRLRASDAEQLSRLQEAMEFGRREARRLAEEIATNEGLTIEMRDRQDKDRKSAEALAKLLDCQVDRMAEMLERKGRRNQWLLLIAGAILGVAVQALAQWIF